MSAETPAGLEDSACQGVSYLRPAPRRSLGLLWPGKPCPTSLPKDSATPRPPRASYRRISRGASDRHPYLMVWSMVHMRAEFSRPPDAVLGASSHLTATGGTLALHLNLWVSKGPVLLSRGDRTSSGALGGLGRSESGSSSPQHLPLGSEARESGVVVESEQGVETQALAGSNFSQLLCDPRNVTSSRLSVVCKM